MSFAEDAVKEREIDWPTDGIAADKTAKRQEEAAKKNLPSVEGEKEHPSNKLSGLAFVLRL